MNKNMTKLEFEIFKASGLSAVGNKVLIKDNAHIKDPYRGHLYRIIEIMGDSNPETYTVIIDAPDGQKSADLNDIEEFIPKEDVHDQT